MPFTTRRVSSMTLVMVLIVSLPICPPLASVCPAVHRPRRLSSIPSPPSTARMNPGSARCRPLARSERTRARRKGAPRRHHRREGSVVPAVRRSLSGLGGRPSELDVRADATVGATVAPAHISVVRTSLIRDLLALVASLQALDLDVSIWMSRSRCPFGTSSVSATNVRRTLDERENPARTPGIPDATRTGREIQRVLRGVRSMTATVPPPSRGSSDARPPCSSAICATIERPRPEPGNVRALVAR